MIAQVQQLGGYKTKKAAVNEAFAEFIRHRKQLELMDDFGTIDYDAQPLRGCRKTLIPMLLGPVGPSVGIHTYLELQSPLFRGGMHSHAERGCRKTLSGVGAR